MFGPGKFPGPNRVHEGPQRLRYVVRILQEVMREAWAFAWSNAQQVVQHQHLSITMRARAYAYGWNMEAGTDLTGQIAGDAFQHQQRSPGGFQNRTGRLFGSYRADLSLGSRHLLSGGADVEHETGSLGGRGGDLLEPTRTSFGVYAQDRVLLGSRAYVTLGGRVERNDSYGTVAVPRLAVAFRVREGIDATTLRSSFGMGLKAPSFLESFGESFFARGNPDLIVVPQGQTTGRPLSTRVGLNVGAAVSPDGSAIALTLSEGGNTDIYLLAPDEGAKPGQRVR